MNTRFIIYGLVAVVLFTVLSGDPELDPAMPTVDTREAAGLKSLCLQDVVEFDGKMAGKLKFCECVVEKFAASVSSDEQYRAYFKNLISQQNVDSYKPELKARALASYSPSGLVTSSDKVNTMIARFNFRYTHDHLSENFDELGKRTDRLWKVAMVGCSRFETK